MYLNLIIVAAVMTVGTCAQLPSRSYIPPHQGGQSSAGSGGSGYSSGFAGVSGFASSASVNTRSQQHQETTAAILKQEQDIDESGSYHFGYETENGIRAEEAGNPLGAQGGFSYKGDDGRTYTITYTSGVAGFRAEGEHLPVAPPTPQAILEALQKNAKDEAAGIFDDGKYNPAMNGGSAGNILGFSGKASGNIGFSVNSGFSHQTKFSTKNGYTY